MVDRSGDRAARIAALLGVVQEARRLRHRWVGSEHLLVTTFADPVVRSALAGVQCDLRDVQERVRQIGQARGPDATTPEGLTPEAHELIARATGGLPDLDLDRTPDPRLFSTLLGLVMITLLHDEQDTAARRILDQLDVLRHSRRLVLMIERNWGPSVLPAADRR